MKIITLFKSFLTIGITAVGVTSAVVFSGVNNITAPYARILTKENYDAIKLAQGTKNININYETLPTSTETIVDLMTTNDSSKSPFMFTVGSQAYQNTNLLLNGVMKDWDNGGNPNMLAPSGSLMLDLYDLFYSGKNPKLSNLNMSFYSYIDIVSTKNYKEAEQLLNYRRNDMGDLWPDKQTPGNEESRLWKVLNANGNWDPAAPDLQPVVIDGAKFIYYPNYDAFYEFRPNNLHDTEYERIYYRRDAKTKEFLDATNWISNYSNNYVSQPFAREGSLYCAKYNDNSKIWEFKSFVASTDFESHGRNKTLQDIINFYLL